RQIRGRPVPRHLGIILDGNRRYALERGFVDPCQAYALGARKLDDVLLWCAELSIPAVSLWVLSTDNFRRDPSEVVGILSSIEAKLVPIPTSSFERAARCGSRGSCSGRARTASSTSATFTGRRSGRSTSCAPCARSRSGIVASDRKGGEAPLRGNYAAEWPPSRKMV